jgi:hypothetical protein
MISVFMILQCSSSPAGKSSQVQPVTTTNSKPNGFAVLELFTSQGCSSCPPADRKLNELTDKAEKSGMPIYTLAYHVDYWNRLGWKDPYSMKLFSDRQSWYSGLFESGSVYTPQLIVNGVKEMVGSRSTEIDQSVDHALNQSTMVEVGMHVNKNGTDIICELDIKNRPLAECVINVALVVDDITTQIKRGENSGKTLIESGIVLKLISKKLEREQLKITMPGNEIKGNYRVVVFIQDEMKGIIYGAADAKLL